MQNIGVTFQFLRDGKGLTKESYHAGLDMWRRNKKIEVTYKGLDLYQYPNRKLLGYSAMDSGTIEQLEAGARRLDRKEDARWGFGVYVTDDPSM
jgi:magnesium-dependent phosphatase 1